MISLRCIYQMIIRAPIIVKNEHNSVENAYTNKIKTYLCNVFFIVLDLRLTGAQRHPIFFNYLHYPSYHPFP